MSDDLFEISEGISDKAALDEAAVVGARAFHTDPFYEWLAPPAMLRARGMAIYCHTMLSQLGPGGLVRLARHDGRIAGISAWVAPGGYPFPVANQIGQLRGLARAFIPMPHKALLGRKYIEANEKVHPKQPHWYLALLCTDPEQQGRGVGSALIAPGLEQADADGVDAYLETQKESNLSWYGRFGFEVVHELHAVKDGPPLWTMLRPARG